MILSQKLSQGFFCPVFKPGYVDYLDLSTAKTHFPLLLEIPERSADNLPGRSQMLSKLLMGKTYRI